MIGCDATDPSAPVLFSVKVAGLHILDAELAQPSPRSQVRRLHRNARNAERVRVPQHRHNQPIGCRDRDSDVDELLQDYCVIAPGMS